jgi:hypothetical protein
MSIYDAARNQDPFTSHLAGLEAELSKEGIEEAILDALRGGSLTSHEISTLTGIFIKKLAYLCGRVLRPGPQPDQPPRSGPQQKKLEGFLKF